MTAFRAALIGADQGVLPLSDLPVSDTKGLAAGSASATYRLTSSGGVESQLSTGGVTDQGDWTRGHVSSIYEVRATVNSGLVSSGTTGSWLPLTSDRAWTVNQVGTGSETAELAIEVRKGSTVLTSATISLSATVLSL